MNSRAEMRSCGSAVLLNSLNNCTTMLRCKNKNNMPLFCYPVKRLFIPPVLVVFWRIANKTAAFPTAVLYHTTSSIKLSWVYETFSPILQAMHGVSYTGPTSKYNVRVSGIGIVYCLRRIYSKTQNAVKRSLITYSNAEVAWKSDNLKKNIRTFTVDRLLGHLLLRLLLSDGPCSQEIHV